MALASQTARTESVGRSSRGNWSRGRKRRPEVVAGVVVLALVLIAASILIIRALADGSASPASNAAGPLAADPMAAAPAEQEERGERRDERSAAARPTAPLPNPVPPPTRGPVVVDMGSPSPSPVETAPRTPANRSSTPNQTDAEARRGSGELAAAAPSAPAAPTGEGSGMPAHLRETMAAAERATKENRVFEARTLLNRALADPRTREPDREALRTWIGELNETLVFSPTVVGGDPLSETYAVQRGDSLARIVSRLGLAIDHRFLARVNRMADPNRLNVGQKLKVVRGPFHAIVDKSAFRLDLYAGDPVPPTPSGAASAPPSPAGGPEPGWVFVRSFPVGLGEHGTTPIGSFVVRKNSKLLNPFWKNPRTGEEFAATNPANPIGEHWLGLDGVDNTTRTFTGYGIHGTIAPDSIGKEMSMGCVRMRADDIAVVWELLQEGVSTVRIVP